jgi:hypothetical protein
VGAALTADPDLWLRAVQLDATNQFQFIPASTAAVCLARVDESYYSYISVMFDLEELLLRSAAISIQ